MTRPLVSVILPTFNASTYLPQAVRSVFRQEHRPIELIVVDDGSTDDTAAVLASLGLPIRYRRQENQGPGAARSNGIRCARGSTIGFIDSDDLWPDNKLAVQLNALEAAREAQVVAGKVQVETIMAVDGPAPARFEPQGEPGYVTCFGSVLVRRSVFDRVDINPALRRGEDLDWFLRAKEIGIVFTQVDDVVLRYRLHGDNLTAREKPHRPVLFEMIKQSLDRRRTSPAIRDGGSL